MARVLACKHCGAPHRLVRSQTRFSCEWCGGANTGSRAPRHEELVAVGPGSVSRARPRIEETLRRRGVQGVQVVIDEPHWVGLWQIVSEEGEEFWAPAASVSKGIEKGLRLPPAALVARENATSEDLPPIPQPERDEASVVEAARASFAESDSEIGTVRLVWMAAQSFRAETASSTISGTYLTELDDVVIGSIPAESRVSEASRGNLVLLGCCVLLALGCGALIEDAVVRAIVEIGIVAGFAAVWMLDVVGEGRRRA